MPQQEAALFFAPAALPLTMREFAERARILLGLLWTGGICARFMKGFCWMPFCGRVGIVCNPHGRSSDGVGTSIR